MPGCRRSTSNPTVRPEAAGLALSRYIVGRGAAVRAANDNRRSGSPAFWHWALAIGAAPVFSAGLLLAMMF